MAAASRALSISTSQSAIAAFGFRFNRGTGLAACFSEASARARSSGDNPLPTLRAASAHALAAAARAAETVFALANAASTAARAKTASACVLARSPIGLRPSSIATSFGERAASGCARMGGSCSSFRTLRRRRWRRQYSIKGSNTTAPPAAPTTTPIGIPLPPGASPPSEGTAVPGARGGALGC